MDFFEVVAKRASVRSLQPVEVTDADLERILEAGRRAPSGSNKQPIEFIVIREQETIARLSRAQGCLADVGLTICVAADPAKSNWWLEDVAAATTQMLLAVTALGYASVWIQGTLLRVEQELKPVLGLPEGMRLVVALPIGKPKEPVVPREKRPLTDMVHWERYGQKQEA